MIQERYRKDYDGEFIVVETRWTQGKKNQTREWIPNPIENHHISGRSVCIGSDIDLHNFDYTRLQRHRGGLLGSKKLQTYSIGNIAHGMRCDFIVETDQTELANLKSINYPRDNIVYTSSRNCLLNPGEFYLIPFNPKFVDLATIVYLAAFDGHKEIFLLGYNKETPCLYKNWQAQIEQIIATYRGIDFFFVGESTIMPTQWLDYPNSRSMTYREFISYCDV